MLSTTTFESYNRLKSNSVRIQNCFKSYPPFPLEGRMQDVFVEVLSDESLPLLAVWQGELDHLVETVVDGPVKLLRRVTGQHQHEPGETGVPG